MNTEEFNKARTEITDEQLINKTQETLHKLCETGGRSFIMTVPPRIDDTDMILGELINRYKQAIQVQAKVKPEIARMTIEELYAEYEQYLEITLSERDKIIFRYAYFVGKNNMDKKE